MKIERGKFWNPLVVLLALLAVGFGLSSCAKPEPIQIIPPEPSPTPLPTQTPAPIYVYITGKVIAPDVYILEPGSRIKQLVEAAGGFAEGADTVGVNLAQQLYDEDHVHIPAVGEDPPVSLPVVTNPTPLRSSGEIPIEPRGGLVNINTALRDELESLPGIGPVTAQKILDFREMNGSFNQIEDIMDVPGIAEGKFEQIKAFVTVSN